MKYDVLIVGAGPGGIFAAYELMNNDPEKKIAVFEAGHPLEKRKCPIDGKKVKSCIRVTEKDQIAAAFEEAKKNTKTPTIIEFIIDPEEMVYPMVKPGGTLADLIMDC